MACGKWRRFETDSVKSKKQSCCDTNVCAHPHLCVKVITLKLNVLGDGAFGRSLSLEGKVLMIGISVLLKEPRELACLFHHVRTQQKDTTYEPKSKPSPDIKLALTLDVPVSRTVRNSMKAVIAESPGMTEGCGHSMGCLSAKFQGRKSSC